MYQIDIYKRQKENNAKEEIKLKPSEKLGFTLAEVLITLAVIGVIAAITLPSLIANIEDSKWASARERLVYNIREAARSMSSNNGGIGGLTGTAGFINELTKYLSVSKICAITDGCFHTDSTTLKDLNGNALAANSLQTAGLNGGQGFTDISAASNAAGIILNNGTIMSIVYNKLCSENTTMYVGNDFIGLNHVCANIIFDTNGFAPPNQVGKDIGFATVMNPTNTVVTGISPDVADSVNASWWNAQNNCMVKGGTWHLPTKDELNSLFYNKKLIGSYAANWYWASSDYVPLPSMAWHQLMSGGNQSQTGKSDTSVSVRCVQR